MKKTLVSPVLMGIGMAGLAWSFWLSAGWLQLCAGLALFLFGMQCLEEGLRQLAGSRLEQVLAASTATPLRSFMFGVLGATVLQSSSLVVVLVIAFISTGLIQLAAGIAIVLGVNLGSTFGMWLLALAGQNFSLSPLALPLLVLGVLLSFRGARIKATGRIILGVAFIFMGVDQIKGGFAQSGEALNLQLLAEPDFFGQALFVGLGFVVTLVLQSSHATLMLVLAALATGQLQLWQALPLTLGANIGSSLSTALMGALSGNRSGQRLALVHVLFNLLTAIIFMFMLSSATAWMQMGADRAGLSAQSPLLLALFQTVFNAVGVLLFWPWQSRLERYLVKWLPEEAQEPQVLITGLPEEACCPAEPARARYLKDAALASSGTAVQAARQELHHLERLSMEVICHALYQPVSQLTAAHLDEHALNNIPKGHELDAEQLYRCHIKGVYADLLAFVGHLDAQVQAVQQPFWLGVQMAALQLVDAVKDAKHLQKNLKHFLIAGHGPAHQHYLDLRHQLLLALRQLHQLSFEEGEPHARSERLQALSEQAIAYEHAFRQHLFAEVRAQRLDGLQISSLMNDLGYVSRIIQSLHRVALLNQERFVGDVGAPVASEF